MTEINAFLPIPIVVYGGMFREYERRGTAASLEIPIDRQNQSARQFVSQITRDESGQLAELLLASKRYEGPFVAWEIVRTQRAGDIVQNPHLPNGLSLPWTGLEGYFVGTKIAANPSEVVTTIANFGKDIYDKTVAQALTAGDYQTAQALLRTATGEQYSAATYTELNRQFGALLGRLRSQSYENPPAYTTFRGETYEKTQQILAKYIGKDHTATDITITPLDTPAQRKLLRSIPVDLSAKQLTGYSFLLHMGRSLGNPLVRAGCELQGK